MAQIKWDQIGQRFYEAGVDHGVLYPYDLNTQAYGTGVAWNGLTSVNEAPEGAESTPMYADNIKYVSITSAENFKFTINAFTYPEEFEQCEGKTSLVAGVTAAQQDRTSFAFAYRSKIGNDVQQDAGYKLHLVYGAKAGVSSVDRGTINESPEGIEFSWECDTTPVELPGVAKPTAHITVDSRTVDKAVLVALETKLYGGDATEPSFPTPEELMSLLKPTTNNANVAAVKETSK